MQQQLFPKSHKEIQAERDRDKLEQIANWKKEILNEPYLWDMRCWDKYKDLKEINVWFDNNFYPNNCGYITYSIRELLENGISREEIIKLIISNPHIKYKNRLVKCFSNPEKCPKFKKSGNYSECDCGGCE